MDQNGLDIVKNVNRAGERFMFRELIVLLPTLCLSLLRGIASSIDKTRFLAHIDKAASPKTLRDYYGYVQLYAPFPGILLITLVSEFRGRKLAFKTLCVLSLLAAILSYAPHQVPWHLIGNISVATLAGVVLPITTLVICEYCNPKHRFAFLVANGFMEIAGSRVTRLLYRAEVISKESSYLSLFEVVIALMCLASVYWWPESPYWLAGQGRYHESRNALLRLRRDGSEARGELHALEISHRQPTPKLFKRALLIVLLTITVAKCASSGKQYSFLFVKKMQIVPQLSHGIISIFASLILSLVIVALSYKVSRKLIYLVATIIALALLYVLAIWAVSVEGRVSDPMVFYIILLICNILLICGPYNLSLALFNEFIPQKYNTSLSCVASLYFVFSGHLFYTRNFNHLLSEHGFLLVWASLALGGIIILYWLLPETRGKNLLQIESLYMSRFSDKNPEQSPIGNMHNHSLSYLWTSLKNTVKVITKSEIKIQIGQETVKI